MDETSSLTNDIVPYTQVAIVKRVEAPRDLFLSHGWLKYIEEGLEWTIGYVGALKTLQVGIWRFVAW